MSKFFYYICLLPTLLIACMPPKPLQPEVYSTFIASGSTSVTLRGKDLKATRATLGGQIATTLEPSSALDSLQITVPKPLQTGDTKVQLEFDGISSIIQDVHVLPASADVPASDLATDREKYLLRGAGFLAIPPSISQATLDSTISAAGFSSTTTVEPFASSSGVCANRFISIQDNQTTRPTLEGLNTLNTQLEQNLPADVDFELNAVLVSNQPDTFSSSNSPQAPRVTTQALPDGLSSVRIAVLDSGISRHPDFQIQANSIIDFPAGRNFTSEDSSNPEPLATDVTDLAKDFTTSAVVGHGTPIAGIIRQTLQEAVGIDGIRFSAAGTIVPIKICEGGNGRCRSSSAVAGICYATSLASSTRPIKVINLSIGSELSSSLMRQALEHAASQGISIVTSAGNKGTNTARPVNYPAQYSVASTSPAIAGLLAVGSVVQGAGLIAPSAFSSIGNWVSVSAFGDKLDAPNTSGGQTSFSGTSFSAPKVAAAALLLHAQAAPNSVTPSAVKTKIISSVKPIAGCPSNQCGTGLLELSAVLNP